MKTIPLRNNPRRQTLTVACALALAAPGLVVAQSATTQVTKSPIAQAWIDVATHHSDMPGMGAVSGFATGGLSGGLSGLFGGARGGGNAFGNTQFAMAPGKWLDVSVMTNNDRGLATATQNTPSGANFSPALRLVTPEKVDPLRSDDTPIDPQYERPKGKLSLYWGCGDSVRPGQPRTLDAANASLADLQRFFGTARNSTTRGARSASGHPSWPNKQDDRKVPDNASLVGEHQFVGNGIPDSFKVALGPAQDFMAPFAITQQNDNGVTRLEWPALAHTRGYFVAAMGAKPGGGGRDDIEMVIWTSSEVPELGFALRDYQSNAAIDRWISERAVLPASATRCAVPKGVFGDGAMLQATAYGSEAFFGYPPRPTDVRVAWEPQWQTKVRVKSTFMSLLGGMGAETGRSRAKDVPKEEKITPVDLLRGLLGR